MRVHGSGDGGRKAKKEHEGGKGEETEGEREMRVHVSGDGA